MPGCFGLFDPSVPREVEQNEDEKKRRSTEKRQNQKVRIEVLGLMSDWWDVSVRVRARCAVLSSSSLVDPMG